METKKCSCQKCKGKIVPRKTFYRHLLNDNSSHQFCIKPKQKIVMKSKNSEFDIDSNQYSSDEMESVNNDVSTHSCKKTKRVPIIGK